MHAIGMVEKEKKKELEKHSNQTRYVCNLCTYVHYFIHSAISKKLTETVAEICHFSWQIQQLVKLIHEEGRKQESHS